MTSLQLRSSVAARLARLLALLACGLLAAAPAVAASGGSPDPHDRAGTFHRARMSADLQQKLTEDAQTIDVIVQGDAATVRQLAARYNAPVRRLLGHGGVLRVTAGELDALSQDPAVDHLSADSLVYSSSLATADVTDVAIGADQVWDGGRRTRGVTGRGIGVAVLDSGIDRVQALDGRVVADFDFTDGRDGAPLRDPDNDQYGHGTHIAGLIAGAASGYQYGGPYEGVAPDAYLLNLRVLGADGSGETSDVIDALDWVVAHGDRYGIRVINLSLGHPVYESYQDDPLCQAVERAVRAGFVVVVAAGNLGTTDDGRMVIGGITSPGHDPFALTVGALDTHQTAVRSDDTVATYSSRGPTAFDNLIKPDLVAPGNKLVSLEAPGSYLAETYPELIVSGHGRNGYLELSGTSQAAAVATGAVALVLQASPRLTPAAVKVLLQLSASFLPSAGLIGAGAGSLNVLAAVDLASPGPRRYAPTTVIAEETVRAGNLMIETSQTGSLLSFDSAHPTRSGSMNDISWNLIKLRNNTIVWAGSSITANTIVWAGVIHGNTIVWAGSTTDFSNIHFTAPIHASTIVWAGLTRK